MAQSPDLIIVEPSARTLIEASEARLRLALHAANIGIWDWDVPSGRMIYSGRAKEICGFAPDQELTLDDVRAVTHPEDLPITSSRRQRAFDPSIRDRGPYEYRVVRMDGAVRWVRAHGEAIFQDIDGQPAAVRYTGTLQDITDERRREEERRHAEAEAARREADALYRAYFENTADPLFVVSVENDGSYVVEQTNPAHEAAFGFARGEVRGRRLHELLPPDLFDQVAGHYRRCVDTGAVLHFRDSFEMPEGVRHADTVLVPMRDESGRIVRIMGSSRNVTRQVQAEDALRQAQKMEAVGQLTGGIAHDFNNLLGAIMGGFDLIRRKADDPERVRRLADAGLEAAERGARLTAQLLAFARAQRLEVKPLIVPALVRNLGDLLAGTLGPMIRLSYDLDAEVRPVLADRTQLEMAVLNLAINARDAMPEGGQLTIATRLRQIGEDPELEPGDYVELAVTDSGVGMRPEVAARALDPFFTTKGVGKGTGLGLSQVYGMARQSGGTVRLESRPGAGTIVRILLRGTSAEIADETGTAREGDPEAGSGALVLVVDDDAAMRAMLAESLTTLGHRVVEAADGPGALAALRTHRPQLVVLDFAMPGMNGAEVAREIWRERPALPVLFASGYAETDAIERVAGEGVRFLHKPFRLDTLQAAVAEALAEKVG